MKKIFFAVLLSMLALCAGASIVGVHDPSIIVVYKDANGNSYPVNDDAKSRTKYYYVFGTQFGAAYSLDMINWTYFEPTFLVNGAATSTEYMEAFKIPAAWSGHKTNDNVRGNAWAADIIYNKEMKKWCLYYSMNGDNWKSSIVLHTSDKIEGPYKYVGVAVWGGMDGTTSGGGNDDYKKVTGSSTVDSRYYVDGKWGGTYGVSCIDPNVFYDEDGNLWLLYGSWSGGLFMIKLDEKTGLRDYSYTYGNAAVWDGTTLKSDPYMGIHVGGGYYVSGEGAYIEYMKDPDGNGYYYMFVSYGFYSPEGGYNMRMFRSKNVTGPYADVTGDSPLFAKYIFNYGNNLDRGLPVMQNYKWSWWTIGQTAQGHNSALMDEDGSCYLVYHTKENTGTVYHNVEVHPMLFNRNGWPLATPFEYRVGYGQPSQAIDIVDLAGEYGIIYHGTVDYAKLVCNEEQTLYLNVDGTLTGAYTGTWTYDYANGRHYLTLKTSNGDFEGVVTQQLMDGVSKVTLAFTSVNAKGENLLWGYKKPFTEKAVTVIYNEGDYPTVGSDSFDQIWYEFDPFIKDTFDVENFEAEYVFHNLSKNTNPWENWGVGISDGSTTWYLRADAYSNWTFAGSTVGYDVTGADYNSVYQDKDVTLKLRRTGTTIQAYVYVDGKYIFSASSSNSPTGTLYVNLGGEACKVVLKQKTKTTLVDRETVGVSAADGSYTSWFNAERSSYDELEGDFHVRFTFNNYSEATSTDNWDNYIVREMVDGDTMLIRSDAYAMDVIGSLSYKYDWDWNDFSKEMKGAKVVMDIARVDDQVTFDIEIAAKSGKTYQYNIVQTNAPKSKMSFGFTVEASMVELLRYEIIKGEKKENATEVPLTEATLNASMRVFSVDDVLFVDSPSCQTIVVSGVNGVVRRINVGEGRTKILGLQKGVYIINGQKVLLR